MTIIFPITTAMAVFVETSVFVDDLICDVMDRLMPKMHMLMGIAACPICKRNDLQFLLVGIATTLHSITYDVPNRVRQKAIREVHRLLCLSSRQKDHEAE